MKARARGRPRTSTLDRTEQLRRAKRAQRTRERAAGLVGMELRVPAALEKFLANADRGVDAATLSRDIVDLAFMIGGWKIGDAQAGLKLAESAYGASVRRSVAAVRAKLRADRSYRNRCIEGLGIEDVKTLSSGLEALSAFS